MQIFVVVLVVVVFVVSCNWFFPANHKSVSVLFLLTCILYCIAFLLLREAFLRMRIPSYYNIELIQPEVKPLQGSPPRGSAIVVSSLAGSLIARPTRLLPTMRSGGLSQTTSGATAVGGGRVSGCRIAYREVATPPPHVTQSPCLKMQV